MVDFNDSRELANILLGNAAEQLATAAPRINHFPLWSVGGASALPGFDHYAEETAVAQAVLGDIDAALVSAETFVRPDFRARNVRFVCMTELFRSERWADASQLFNQLYPARVAPNPAAHLALGANHRLPWLGYPFPVW